MQGWNCKFANPANLRIWVIYWVQNYLGDSKYFRFVTLNKSYFLLTYWLVGLADLILFGKLQLLGLYKSVIVLKSGMELNNKNWWFSYERHAYPSVIFLLISFLLFLLLIFMIQFTVTIQIAPNIINFSPFLLPYNHKASPSSYLIKPWNSIYFLYQIAIK